MADRSVDLVIRARNEASAVLQAITASLAGLNQTQDTVGKSAQNTGSTINNLVKVLADLGTQAQALQAFGKVTTQLDTMSKTVGTVSLAAEQATAKVEALGSSLSNISAQNTVASARLSVTSNALKAQAEAVTNDARALKSLESQIASTQNKLASLDARSASGKGLSIGQNENYQELENRLRTLVGLRDNAAAQSTQSQSNLAPLATRYDQEKVAADTAAQAVTKLTSEYAVASGTAQRLGTTLQTITAEHSALAASVATVASQLGIETVENNNAAAAATRNADAQARLKEVIAGHAASVAAQPVGNPGQFGVGGPAASATAAYRAQVQATQEAGTAATAAAEKATRLGAALAGVQAPSAALVAEFQIAKIEAQTAANAYDANTAALQRLRSASSSAGSSVASAVQQSNAATLQRLQSSVTGAANQASAARQIAEQKSLEQAVLEAQKAHSKFAETLDKTSNNVNGAVGNLAKLATAYFATTEAVHLLKDAISEAVSYEAAQVRVTLALGQGSDAGAAAFQHVADKAKELKLQIVPAVEQYGKFLSAVKGTSIEGPKATQIFDDLLTTARAFKLDPSNIDRATVALRDMAANGNVNLRFLRQLDQALPIGLLSRFAQGAGYSADNLAGFTKALHEGKVGLDVILPAFQAAAAEAGKGLPAALGTAQSTFVDFQNAVLGAQLALTNGGFLNSVVAAVNQLTAAISSPEGQNAARQLGSVFAALVDIFAKLIPYAKTLVISLLALGAIKVVGIFAGFEGLAAIFSAATNQVQLFTQTAAVARAEILATGAAFGEMAAAEAAAAAEGGILAGSLAFLASPVGIVLAIGGLVAGLVAYLSTTKASTDASVEYKKVLADIKDQVDQNAQSQNKLNAAIQAKGLFDAEQAVIQLRKAYAEAEAAVTKFGNSTLTISGKGANARDLDVQSIRKLVEQLKTGKIPSDDFAAAFDKLNASLNTDAGRALLGQLKPLLDTLKDRGAELSVSAGYAETLGSKIKGLAEDASRVPSAFGAVKTALSSTNGDLQKGIEAWSKYHEALAQVTKDFPLLKAEADRAAHALDEQKLISAANALPIAAGPDNSPGNRRRDAAIDQANSTVEREQTLELEKALKSLPGYTQQIDNLFTRIFRFESAGDPLNFPGKVSGQAVTQSDLQRSGAFGQGQFLRSTFDQYFKETFPQLVTGPQGFNSNQIAAQRANPDVVRAVAATFIEDIQAQLHSTSARDTYLGYNLGIGGAKRLLSADPNDSAKNNIDPASYAGNAALYQGTVQQSLDRIAKIMADGNVLTSTGQTKQEASSQAATNAIEAQIAKLKAQTEGAKNIEASEKDKFVNTQVAEAQNKFKNELGESITDSKQLSAEQQKLLETVRQTAAAEYDASHAKDDEKAKIADIVALEEQRKALIQEMKQELGDGDVSGAEATRKKIQELTQQIIEALPHAKELAATFKDTSGVASLDKVGNSLKKNVTDTVTSGKQINDLFTGDFTSGFKTFVDELEQGKGAVTALKDGFLSFASSFLSQIAEMILKQTVLNLLQQSGFGKGISDAVNGITSAGSSAASSAAGAASSGGGGFFSFISSLFSAAHGGGIVGPAMAMSKPGNVSWFVNAPRFHDGGFPGLSADEIPIIAKRGERVQTEAQQDAERRARSSGDSSGAATSATHIYNILDPDETASRVLSTPTGERAVINHIRTNKAAIKSILG